MDIKKITSYTGYFEMFSKMDFDIENIIADAKKNNDDHFMYYDRLKQVVHEMIYDYKDGYKKAESDSEKKEIIKVINKLHDLDKKLEEIKAEKFRWERPFKKIKKLKWLDNNYLSLMGLIELLEKARFIPENSFKNCGSIANYHFEKNNGSKISEFGFNNKKKAYEKNKIRIIQDFITRLDIAFEEISKEKENHS